MRGLNRWGAGNVNAALEAAYAAALALTLWTTALGIGASHDLGSLRSGLERRGLFGRLLVLDIIIVPLIVLGLVRLLSVPNDLAVGLLIVGAAAAGPLGLKTAQLARGDVPLAIALVIVLELLNIVVMPIWAAVAIPGIVALPLAEILRTLIVGVLVPLSVGLAIRAWAPRFAPRVSRWATPVSTIGLAVLIAIVLTRDGAAVADATFSAVPAVAVATILAAMTLGWWFGGPDAASRRTAAMVSSVRANAVALAVSTTAVGASAPATSAIVVFGLCSFAVVPAVAAVLGWRSRRVAYEADGPAPSPSRSAPTS
jgi:bile acid:Na+ symporter, BASS family